MPLATDDPRPKSVQIADALREDIKRGRFAPGAKLPTRKELAARFEVASQTVQNGLDILRAEGLIFSAGNRGVFVSKDRNPNEADTDVITELRSQVQELAERVTALEERSDQPSA